MMPKARIEVINVSQFVIAASRFSDDTCLRACYNKDPLRFWKYVERTA